MRKLIFLLFVVCALSLHLDVQESRQETPEAHADLSDYADGLDAFA